MSEDDILQCECGSIHWTIARDGLIECAECKHPNGDHIAGPANVTSYLQENGVEIIDPEVHAH